MWHPHPLAGLSSVFFTLLDPSASTPDDSLTSLRPAVSLNRPSRARVSSPRRHHFTTSTHSHEPSPIPPHGALSIFETAPPSALPEALQEVIGSSSSSRHGDSVGTPGMDSAMTTDKDKEGDTLMREADQGFNSRLRSKRSKEEVVVKTGINASGKGVKVSGHVKEAGKPLRKKGKGRGDQDIPNQDFCSACRGTGKFLCCDGCPRSFHFMCLEPPFKIDELPQEETWYCKKCRAERVSGEAQTPAELWQSRDVASPARNRDPRPIPMVFRQLVKRVEEENPTQFRLPNDIRQFFSGVGTDGKGNYFDAEETRTKYDRKGFQEERDGTKLRDGRSKHVACYACGGTSIPLKSVTTDPGVAWRQIVSCDYCALHWHLDCLNPPLATMPNSGRKWMCPNHVDQVIARRRTLRNNLETIDVEYQGQPNNGNITILPDDQRKETFDYEDMIINKRKYRVPEKIIKLDFWNKIRQRGG
ncbi:hypothetical protein BD324DRAFT_578261 [Kockovaella imperatae]|uniref:PHD-type domain-containing protein n=1 Tax=Kockovaella imperatae TaxID=4999 RepID=A0A1Y1UML5_9TREE|nr:hypothetical protein BD324DRAFT_578261 [Kockovaella imperatae]ORX38375.1 hypothetical protein BD324DRAFT_578261 [Kockovaella imperatae]